MKYILLFLFIEVIMAISIHDPLINNYNPIIANKAEDQMQTINKLNDEVIITKGKNLMKNLNDYINLQTSITPKLEIESIDSHIDIKLDHVDGEIYESVNYVLYNGVFDTIIRKISLAGTSDQFIGFKLSSR